MKSIGFVLIAVGVLVAYLGFYGKLGDAVTAIYTGKTPDTLTKLSGDTPNPNVTTRGKDTTNV